MGSPRRPTDPFTLLVDIDNSTTTWPTPTTLDPASPVKCRTHHYNNKTVIFYGGYEGIPENLLVNVLAWLVCMLLFCFLRKSLGNYGRIGLIEGPNRRPTNTGATYDLWTQTGGPESLHSPDHHDVESVSSVDNTALDHGIFSWIFATFMLSDEQILTKCGSDAVHYLSFQRHLIMLMAVFTFLALTVALPVNMRGTKVNSDFNQFASTTYSNLDPASWLVVIHITLSIVFLIIGIYFVRRFSARLRVKETESFTSRTLMITKFPISMCNKDSILRHFREAYPVQPVEEVIVVSDMNQLLNLEKQKKLVHRAKKYTAKYNSSHTPLRMKPWTCGYVCGKVDCCECCQTVDALEYYSGQEHLLSEKIIDARKKALCTPLGIVFVTFASFEDARKVLSDHRFQRRKNAFFGKNPGKSSLSTAMKPEDWNVEFAPPSNDIYWEHLRTNGRFWVLKWLLIHTILFVVLIFFSTPSVVLSSINVIWAPVQEELTKLNPLFSEFAATVLLLSTATLLPVLISLSDRFLTHWTRSSANLSLMIKTFTFLIFMVLLLPSLGLASIDAFVQWTLNDGKTRWDCVFLPDNGAFFVNYIITSAFVGTSMDLMRIAELIYYYTCLGLSKSRAEHLNIRQASLFEFGYGIQYAWVLMKFSVVTMYSLSCPLITPFGLIYLVMKHFVDRYNIYFAYAPSKISKRVHIVAIYFLVTALFLLQLSFFFFSLLRRGLKDATIYSLFGLVFSLLLMLAPTSFHLFKKIGPILFLPYDELEPRQAEEEDEVDTGNATYAPPYKLTNGVGFPTSDSSESPLDDVERGGLSGSPRRTYGTDSPSGLTSSEEAGTSVTFRAGSGLENPLYQNY